MAFSPVAVGSEVSPEPGGSGSPGEEADGERELLPRLAERLVPGSRLKEVVGASLASLCLAPLAGPQRLGTLVDCLVLNYRLWQGLGWSRDRGAAAEGGGAAEGPLRCCGCGRFLSEPVTVPCGHTYCRRCLRRELRARCRRCRDWLLPAGGTSTAAAPLRTSVVLNQLVEKWFPGECERARAGSRLEELLAQGRFREALAAASQALRAGKACGERALPPPGAWPADSRPCPAGSVTGWERSAAGLGGWRRGGMGALRFFPALQPLSPTADAVSDRNGPIKSNRSFLEFVERIQGTSP